VTVYTIVGIVIANVIDPVYHMASTMVYRHRNHKYLARGFVGAVQGVAVVCSPVDLSLGEGIGLESASGVGTTDKIVDVELLEGDMTSPKELRGLLSSLNYLSAWHINS
jgi:hypothetical protein